MHYVWPALLPSWSSAPWRAVDTQAGPRVRSGLYRPPWWGSLLPLLLGLTPSGKAGALSHPRDDVRGGSCVGVLAVGQELDNTSSHLHPRGWCRSRPRFTDVKVKAPKKSSEKVVVLGLEPRSICLRIQGPKPPWDTSSSCIVSVRPSREPPSPTNDGFEIPSGPLLPVFAWLCAL